MGWLLQIAALIVGLITLSLGLWPVALVCFAYLGVGVWTRLRRRTVFVREERRRAPGPARAGRLYSFKKRYVLAAACFFLALVSVRAGGTYSPLVFASVGFVIVASGVSNRLPSFSSFEPIQGSIVLRGRWLPLRWVALVEVKFGTRHLSKALSCVGSEMVMTFASEMVSVYVPIRVWASSLAEAEAKVASRLGPMAKRLSTRSAYILPLDSIDAATRLGWSLKPVNLALDLGKEGLNVLNSGHFDVLVLSPARHTLESVGAYESSRNERTGIALLPQKGRKLLGKPLLWEALEVLAERHVPESADSYANFLSAVSATRGEGLGERLNNEGQTNNGTVLLSSLGTQQVELTRPQLRAIVTAYG